MWDNLAGLGQAALDAFTDPVGIRRASQLAQTLATNGVDGTAAKVWDGITKPYTSRWNSGDQAGAIGYGVVEIAITLAGTKGATKLATATRIEANIAADTVAIGRNMGQRVIPYAERNGYGYYKGTPEWVPRKTIARMASPATLDKVDLLFNKRWINSQMRQGNRIVDIGEPPGYPPSDFYNMELNQVRGYGNYSQDIQP